MREIPNKTEILRTYDRRRSYPCTNTDWKDFRFYKIGTLDSKKILKFDNSLEYIDNPSIVFKHPKANFFLRATTDYNLALSTLDDIVLPIYIPKIGNNIVDSTLYESLRRDLFKWARNAKVYEDCEIRAASKWLVAFSLFPDVSYQRRLTGIKFLLFTFIFDDPLEQMVADDVVEDLAEPYINNVRKLATMSEESLVDLAKITNLKQAASIQLALKAQNLLVEVMLEFKGQLTEKAFQHLCGCNDVNYRFVEKEIKLWARKMRLQEMATEEERISCKHISSGLPLVYYPMLLDDDVEYHPLGSYISRISTMADCESNDVFSYFKEEYDTPFCNVMNLVGIYRSQGLAEATALRKVLKQRNELFRSIEVGLEYVPVERKKSLSKILITLTGTTHYHFISVERYGWSPLKLVNY